MTRTRQNKITTIDTHNGGIGFDSHQGYDNFTSPKRVPENVYVGWYSDNLRCLYRAL